MISESKKIAVVISAWNCAEYIMDCVKSVKRQRMPLGWEYELRIGVDGCQATSDVLTENNIPHYFYPENVGSYIIRNSLIYLGKADMYAYFDADDVMFETYLKENIKVCINKKIVMAKKINTDIKLKPDPKCTIVDEGRGGAMTFTQDVLDALGGYRSFRCSSDCDFVARATKAGFRRVVLSRQLYYRRRHPDSLTISPETNIKSEYRKKSVKEMKRLRNELNIIHIEAETVQLIKKL